MDNTTTDFENLIKNLPQETQDAILAADLPHKINSIGMKYSLRVDQLGALMGEVNMAMLGLTRPDDFQSSIITSLNLPPEKASGVVNDVNSQILSPIRESLRKEGGESLQKAPTKQEDNKTENKRVSEEEMERLMNIGKEEAVPTPEENLKSAGVEIIGSEADIKPITIVPQGSGIPSNIVGLKMNESFRLPKKETDLSMPKIPTDQKDLPNPGIMAPSASPDVPSSNSGPSAQSPAPAPASKIDPYREKPI